jgi:hypothetical protein
VGERRTPPSKVSLDASADQQLAEMREMRAKLEALGPIGDELLFLGESMALLLREQFPAERSLGRITLAVAQSLQALESAAQSKGYPLGSIELTAIAQLAAEQLDRESRS